MKKKLLYTVITAILLILVYMLIFFFSSEDAEQSSAVSKAVTEIFLKVYYLLAGNSGGTGTIATDSMSLAEGIVRKIAHFTEFGCLGFLAYNLIQMWYSRIGRGRLLVLIQLFLSAAVDELHQYFIPGRYASVRDVLIDVAGGLTGMCILILILRFRRKRKNQLFS